jgi:ATP-dependent helicase/nuclease subunit B
LPRTRAFGDPDEDAALILGAEGGAEDDLEGTAGARAIGPLERRLALMRLVLAWGEAERARGGAADTYDTTGRLIGHPLVATPAQASSLAADLARLMDVIETEEVDLSALPKLVPDEYAEHWQHTLEFLKILTEYWPQHLRERGLVSPVAWRNRLMEMEAERLRAGRTAGPVIAAGSTGTVPATARLLSVIASLPNGAVVLPGLDLSLDQASWDSLGEHPEHPQFCLAQLLSRLGATREDVVLVPGCSPNARMRARASLVSEALRSADQTDMWREYLARGTAQAVAASPPKEQPASRQLELELDEKRDRTGDMMAALAGMNLIEAPTALDEAEAIALVLRDAIETQGKTAALITPDRALARRVAVSLRRFGLIIDDSAGTPIARTVPGAFLDLVLPVVETNFAPPALMALLKHPLSLVGQTPAAIRQVARTLERAVFRRNYVGQGLVGAEAALRALQDKEVKGPAWKINIAAALVADLIQAFAPLTALFAKTSPVSAAELARAHSAAAEALARDAEGSPAALWQSDAGEALSLLFTELMTQGDALKLEARDYAPFWRGMLAGQVVRPRGLAHHRLSIWGPLEARLQQPDLVFLSGLNEGAWPRPQEVGPWLSRPMRAALGLSPPERKNGLAAHDFAQGLSAPTVYLTRALKVDGVPTVASRWLRRLLALVDAAKLRALLDPPLPFAAWARDRDKANGFAPAPRPAPCPPAEARPKKLSISRVERLIANPYEIFARDILELDKLEALGAEPDARARGQVVHRVLREFALRHPDALPEDIEGELVAIADGLFVELGTSPRVAAFWRPQLKRFARWFAATEATRRAEVERVHAEVGGELKLEAGNGFRLTGRADRIDVLRDGALAIYDYKTGAAPSQTHVDELYAPQLPLEAAMAAKGGFGALGAREVRRLCYIEASGKRGGAERDAGMRLPSSLGKEAYANLVRLVERYARADTPYEAKRRPAAAFKKIYPYDEYAQLARLKEWAAANSEGEEA